MSGHEQYAEDLALYALDALTGEDRQNLEKHLSTCAACRLELEHLRGDGALLAMSTLGPKPPARARQRLLDAVSKERPARATAAPRRSWWGWLGWAATAAVIVFAASLWKENVQLQHSLSAASSEAQRTQRGLEELKRVVGPILAQDAQRITLVAVKSPPQPQGKAFYLKNRGNLVFVASNMQPLPPQKAYELWLIPKEGNPVPAGVFKPDVHGSATVVNPPLPAGVEAKAFAITVENEAGAATPTMPIVMMGSGE